MDAVIAIIILSIGSLLSAAAFIKIGLTPASSPILSRVLLAHMHLMGKLTVVKLKLPLSNFLPMDFSISFPDDLRRWISSVSFRWIPPPEEAWVGCL